MALPTRHRITPAAFRPVGPVQCALEPLWSQSRLIQLHPTRAPILYLVGVTAAGIPENGFAQPLAAGEKFEAPPQTPRHRLHLPPGLGGCLCVGTGFLCGRGEFSGVGQTTLVGMQPAECGR